MGKQGSRRGRGYALTAALLTTFAWPATALAQDAIDVDSSFATFTPSISVAEDFYQAPSEGRIAPLDGQRDPRCDNGSFNGSAAIPRTGYEALGAIGATYTSNASESDGGEDDLLTTTTLRLDRARASERGLCRMAGSNVILDPRWRFTLTGQSLTLAYREDNGADASRFLLSGRFEYALDDHANPRNRDRYFTRVFASLDNAVSYAGLYDDWVSTSHDARVGISHILRLYQTDAANPFSGNGSLSVQASAGRVFANPERASYNVANVTLTRDWLINAAWMVRAAGSVTYQNYDQAAPVEFDDTRYRLAFTVRHTFAPDTAIEMNVNADARTSDIPVREFEAISMPLSFRFVRKF